MTTVLSLPEGSESVNEPLPVSCKLLASQMGFYSVLDPRDFCVCILIVTQGLKSHLLFSSSEMEELNAFKQFFKKEKATFLKCQLLPVHSSESRKTP